METIRWAICDDVSYVCDSIELTLKKYEDLQFVGAAYTTQECKSLCSEKKPDILLLDIQMEDDNSGIFLIPLIKRISPETKIIMLTSYTDESLVFTAFSQGADNYISKSSPTQDIYITIKNLFDGQYTLNKDIMDSLIQQSQRIARHQQSLLYIISILSTLSHSEFEILKSVCSGKTYRQIAQDRFVELGTIKKQVSRILKKFNSNNMKDIIEDLTALNVFDIYDDGIDFKDGNN